MQIRASTDAKGKCIAKFTEWWESAEDFYSVISDINPRIFRMVILNESITNTDKLAEILYDMVGPHFLKNVGNDNEKRRTFLNLILKTAIQNKHVRKKDILNAARSYASKKQKETIADIQDVPKLNMTARLARQLAIELDLPQQVAETERAEKMEPTEVITPHSSLNPLYDYQYTSGRLIRRMLEGKTDHRKRILRRLITIPTGAGKTRMVVETIIEWLNAGKKSESAQQRDSKFVLWVAQSGELCEQAFGTFKVVFESVGKPGTALHMHRFWGSGGALPDNLEMDDLLSDRGVIVATIQSLYKLLGTGQLGTLADLTSCIVIDEAHHTTATSYSKVLREMGFNWDNRKSEISEKGIVLIGLTATPFRGTGTGTDTERLIRWFDDVYLPNISYKPGMENSKPHALIDCQTYVNVGEHVRILGERSYDRDGYIDDDDYFWRITRWDEARKDGHGDEWTFERQKNIEFRPENPGEYEITLKVIDNEGDHDTAIARMHAHRKPQRKDEELEIQQKNLYETLTKRDILCNVYHLVLKSAKFQVSKKEVEHIEKWGEFSEMTLKSVEQNTDRNMKIIKEISALRDIGIRKILFFGCSVDHSRMISILLKTKYGIKSDYVDAHVGIDARIGAIERFRTGDLEVLCNFNILTAGFDAPGVDCVFVGRPVRSTLLYTQMIGRGMRGTKTGGTEDMLLVDIDDNFQLRSGHELDIAKLGWKTFSSYWEYIRDRSQFPGAKQDMSAMPTGFEEEEEPASAEESESTHALSHSCSECNVNAVGIESIERIFGIVGNPKVLLESLTSKGHPGIPQKCQKCRGKGDIRIPKPSVRKRDTAKPLPSVSDKQMAESKTEHSPTAEDIDGEFERLRDVVYAHMPTSRQFWELANPEIRKAMNRLYDGYHGYLEAKGITIQGDHGLEDNLYDEYFELYVKTDKQKRTRKVVSAKNLHKYGKYNIDDYAECFGTFEEFESHVDAIIQRMNTVGRNASLEELVTDYKEIARKCRHKPHFEEVRTMSKFGIEHYLNLFGSLSRFIQIKSMHRKSKT